MDHIPRDMGWIEVICGPMFSGKTEELIKRLRRSIYAKQVVQVFKPSVDKRYDAIDIVSHNKQRIVAQPLERSDDVFEHLGFDTTVVGFDEAQFFTDTQLFDVCQALANDNRRVIVSALDQDYRGVPFDPIPRLMAVAEYVTKTLAYCAVCGNPAGRSQRISSQEERIVLGATEAYEPRCRLHHRCDGEAPKQERLFG